MIPLENTIILGTGPAGLTAAIYAARAQLSPLCIDGSQPGGQLTLTSEVENYPGFADPILGQDLMAAFRKQAERFGTRFLEDTVSRVDFSSRPFQLECLSGKKLSTQTIIIATGASAKWLGISSEKKWLGKGVSACATCDGFFFRNQNVAVIGGGDTALEEALFLTRFAKTVTVIHRRDQLRASKVMQERAFHHEKIQFIWDSSIEEIIGDTSVTGIQIRNLKTNQTHFMNVEGVFIAIGHEPNTSLFRNFPESQLECNAAGYLIVRPFSTRTNIPGVFAAGDVSDSVYRQAVTAAGTGCMAAIDVERFLQERGV